MVYVFLADGFEIIEALAPVDMLTRAGVEVKTVGVTGELVKASCGVSVKTDITIDEFDFYKVEAVVLPGGMPGTLNLEKNALVQRAIDNAVNTGVLICAICAAPSILGHKGLLSGREATCFPGFEDALEGAEISDSYVVRDGNYITARGAGVCIDFGLEIVSALKGRELADKIRASIQCNVTKAQLRIRAARERREITDKAEKDGKIKDFLLSLNEYKKADLLLCYASLPEEIGTDGIINAALGDGKRVALPRCSDSKGNMAFYLIESLDELSVGTFGVREPVPACPKVIDFNNSLAVVPGLCFDLHGNRLGYGRGYYDRFLKIYTSLSVGLCYNSLVKNNIPVNDYDKKVALLITEEGIINIGGKNG